MAFQVSISSGASKTTSAQSGTTTTTNKSADLGLIRGVVSDVLNNRSKNIEYSADASAQRTTAAGYNAEIEAYGASELSSEQNAAYSKATGDILAYQSQRQTARTVGQQSAQLAGGGFSGDTGSAVDQVRSSLQEGYLADQLVRTQSLFEQGGYLEQAAASRAQSNAARFAQGAALTTAGVYDTAAEQARTYAANETTGLSGYLGKFNLKTTADDLLSGQDIGTEIATAPKVVDTQSTQTSVTGEPVYQYNIKGAFGRGGGALWREPNDAFSSGLSQDQMNVVGGAWTSAGGMSLDNNGVQRRNVTAPKSAPVVGTLKE